MRTLFAAALLSCFLSAPLMGQWWVAIEVGAARFWGGSVENAPERRSFRPYRPTLVGVALQRITSNWGLGLRLSYFSAALGLEGEDAAVAVNGAFDVYSASPEIIYRVTRVAAGNEVTVRAGPLFEVWSIVDEDSRLQLGVQVALAFTVPLGSRFAGTLLAGGAASPSPFTRSQLIENFEPRTLWRREVAVRLEYQL